MNAESRPGPRETHRGRNVQPHQHDPYAPRAATGGTQVCEGCGALHHAGRWSWGSPPADAARTTCPACRRVHDRYPAGTLILDRPFLEQRDEVLGLLRNEEAAEKAEHPLERLMNVEERPDGLVVTTTGLHLARRVAHALERRFHRKARMHYPEGESTLRVDWEG